MNVKDFVGDPDNIRKFNRAIRNGRAERAPRKPRGDRILVVDSDPLRRNMLVKTLEREGYQVLSAVSDAEAAEVHAVDPVQILIREFEPGNHENLSSLAAFHASHPHLTIVAVSSDSSPTEATIRAARSLGAARTLVRPFDSRKLLETVQELAGDS